MASGRILVAGSLAQDLLFRYDGSFADGLKQEAMEHLSACFYMSGHEVLPGGNAAAIAWTLRLLGEDPLPLSSVGEDGDGHLELLRGRGIDCSRVERIAGEKTAVCVIGTDAGNRQLTFFHDGANARRTWPADLAADGVACAVIAPTPPAVTLDGLRWCAAAGVPCLFDPGQRTGKFTPAEWEEAVSLGAVTLLNAYEAARLDGVASRAGILVVTRGADGCTVSHGGASTDLPACAAAAVVDPTGAGDAFRAGFAAGFRRGWAPEACAMLGAGVASVAVETKGVLMPALNLETVYARMQKAYGETPPAL